MTYWVGTESFRTKDAITQRCRDILGKRLGPVTDELDRSFLASLLSHSPTYEQKTEFGVLGFAVVQGRDSRQFSIVAHFGPDRDFSFAKCIASIGKDDAEIARREYRGRILSAYRTAIHGQVQDFRRKSAGHPCGICGGRIDGISHVDHLIPLSELIFHYEQKLGHELHATTEDCGIDGPNQFAKKFCNQRIADEWAAYHQNHAVLRMTCKRCNLTRRRKSAEGA